MDLVSAENAATQPTFNSLNIARINRGLGPIDDCTGSCVPRFDATLTDPCSAPVAPDRVANCAALGVPAGFTQPNPQISVTTGGNPALDAETADSYTAGFVWNPAFASGATWSERLSFEFTWYRREVEGAIQAIDAQTQLNLCVDTLDPTHRQPDRGLLALPRFRRVQQ